MPQLTADSSLLWSVGAASCVTLGTCFFLLLTTQVLETLCWWILLLVFYNADVLEPAYDLPYLFCNFDADMPCSPCSPPTCSQTHLAEICSLSPDVNQDNVTCGQNYLVFEPSIIR